MSEVKTRLETKPIKLLDIRRLRISFLSKQCEIRVIDGLDLAINKGQTVGMVGESGSGKSLVSLAIMRLIQAPGKMTNGQILFNGQDLGQTSETVMQKIRGNRISMIFQEPMTSLNPTFTIGNQINEVFRIHQACNSKEANKKSINMLQLVGIPSPEKRMKHYPHEMSGGMRQRIIIAMALACHPELLIADEPTTALDVTIQAQILATIKNMQKKMNMAMLLITHNLGIVADMCDHVVVMYAGQIVEYIPAKKLFTAPKHPYTQGLLHSLPRHDKHQAELPVMLGNVPTFENLPPGCRFAPRCPHVKTICHEQEPILIKINESQHVRCWLWA